MVTRDEIIKYVIDTRLLNTCVECQMSKVKDRQFEEDLIQDTWLWLLTYDIEKLKDAYINNHLNALITKYLCNNIFSKTSPYYKNYYRQRNRESEITEAIIETTPDE